MRIRYLLITMLIFFGLSGMSHALLLNFESVSTGSDIVNNPLVTSVGTITTSSTGGSLYISDGSGGGLDGDVLRFDESSDGQYAQLSFDFDVLSVEFLFAGFLSGYFTAQVLDSSFNVLDSFFDNNTNDDLPGGPVTLSGTNIRYFRFFDGPGGLSFAGIDDVDIKPVPEPATMLLLGSGLIGLLGLRRKFKKS